MYTRTIQVFINLPDLINVTHVSPFHKYMQFLSSVPFKILLSKQFVWIIIHIWKKGWCFPLPCQVLGWHFPKRVKSKLLWNAKPLSLCWKISEEFLCKISTSVVCSRSVIFNILLAVVPSKFSTLYTNFSILTNFFCFNYSVWALELFPEIVRSVTSNKLENSAQDHREIIFYHRWT